MRAFLYSKEVPNGKIFTDKAEFEEALKNDWFTAPAALKEFLKAPMQEVREKLDAAITEKAKTTGRFDKKVSKKTKHGR